MLSTHVNSEVAIAPRFRNMVGKNKRHEKIFGIYLHSTGSIRQENFVDDSEVIRKIRGSGV